MTPDNFPRPFAAMAMAALMAMALGACGAASVLAPVETVEVEDTQEVQNLPEPKVIRPTSHHIKSGETLIEIAMNYGLDHRDLAEWNGIADADIIHIGAVLRLSPSPDAPAASPIVKKKSPIVISSTPTIITANTAAPTFTPESGKPKGDISNLPVKDTPLATKHAYTPETLKQLQAQTPTPTIPPVVAAKPPTPSAPSATGANNDDKKPEKLLAQRRKFGVDWSWPSAGAVIEKFSESNKGINIAGDLGAPIYAGADGKVVYVGTGVKSYGRLVIIKHANDYLSAYAHNESIIVAEGQQVKRGQKIATLGNTGAPMPMLHFEIRKAGKPFDPLRVLPQQ